MVKVRFLQSVILPQLNKVVGLDDELDISDEEFAKKLAKNGVVDILIEQKIIKQAPKRPPKKAKIEGD